MRKKLIILTLILSFAFTGIALASANGTFKGYSIINIIVDGKRVKSDVPAINFEGRTMVPIRFVSEELGADVQWDQSTYTVTIKSPSVNGQKNNDIEIIKIYNEIAGHYRSIEQLGSMIKNLGNGLSIAYDQFKFNQRDQLDSIYGLIGDLKVMRSVAINDTNALREKAKSYNLDISDMTHILNEYGKAIDSYQRAADALDDYYYDGTYQSGQEYLSASGKGFDIAFEAEKRAYMGYQTYHNKIRNY